MSMAAAMGSLVVEGEVRGTLCLNQKRVSTFAEKRGPTLLSLLSLLPPCHRVGITSEASPP